MLEDEPTDRLPVDLDAGNRLQLRNNKVRPVGSDGIQECVVPEVDESLVQLDQTDDRRL